MTKEPQNPNPINTGLDYIGTITYEGKTFVPTIDVNIQGMKATEYKLKDPSIDYISFDVKRPYFG